MSRSILHKVNTQQIIYSVQSTFLAPKSIVHSSPCPLFTIKWRRVNFDEAHT